MKFGLPKDCDESIREIHDYWLSIHPAEGLPARDHMDPLDVPSLLPKLWMANVERNPVRFRYRLIGSDVVQILGEDLTGQYFDECFENFDGSVPQTTLVDTCEQGCPAWRRGPAVLIRKDYKFKQMERIFLPFANDGATVDLLLALSVYIVDDGFGRAARSSTIR